MLLQLPLVLASLLHVWPALLQFSVSTCYMDAAALERVATPAVLYVANLLADLNLLALLPGGGIFRAPPALETARGQLCSLYLYMFVLGGCTLPLCAYYLHERRAKWRYLSLARGGELHDSADDGEGHSPFNILTASLTCIGALQLSAMVWWVMLTWLDVCRISGACPVLP